MFAAAGRCVWNNWDDSATSSGGSSSSGSNGMLLLKEVLGVVLLFLNLGLFLFVFLKLIIIKYTLMGMCTGNSNKSEYD
jgi:hypothetical protein